jgi:flagella basal body P-ring formation protein FlgA
MTAFLVSLLCQGLIANAAEIRFRSQAHVDGAVVRLGDIAQVISADVREREALQAMELGPRALNRQTLAAREIQDRLASAGVKLIDHQFAGAAVITVLPEAGQARGDQRALSKSAIGLANAAVADAIVAHLRRAADPDENWTVAVELTPEQARAVSQQGRRVTATGGEAPWSGVQTFQVRMPRGAVGEQSGELFAIAAEVRPSPRAVVAVRAITRGQRIGAADVELQRIEAGTPQSSFFPALEDVVGKEATRNVAPGQVLDEGYVRSPLLVRRGDVVDLYARAGGVQVRTRARAKEEGSHGSLIQVELLTDRRALVARVCGIQEVEILAAGPAVR